jgi:hypothetical protein
MGWWIGGAFLAAALYVFSPLVICPFTLRRNDPAGLPPTLQQIIRRFEWRASIRQCGSHAVLVLILALLSAAAWVFVEATAITTRETSGDLSQKLAQETAKKDTDISEQNRLRDALTAAVKPTIDLIGHQIVEGGARMTIELIDSTGKIKEAPTVAQEIQKTLPPTDTTLPTILITVSGHRNNPSSGLLEPYPILKFYRSLTPDDLARLGNGTTVWEPNDLSSLVNRFIQLAHYIDIDYDVLSRLAFEQRNAEVAKETGEEATTEVSGNLSLPFLLQLNITRFGTITLASIAISILVPLYRFSERLSAFYRARADALRLHQVAGYKTGAFFGFQAC